MKTRWNPRHGAAANARRKLPPLAARYFAEGRALAAREDAPAEEMHAFRLSTKRLRYTLELFRPCYGPGLEKRLDELKKLQQFLGDLNDCAAARRVTSGLTAAAVGERWEAFLDARSAERKAAFRTHWTSVFDAQGRELRWRSYLAGHAADVA